ncbi:MAG: twitch domain-containing radical SAM protein [Bacteriovoracaceae bacterium]|nr:twitch domain-containing radical SAM protein [Bacteriovoracaceae bacterium]
MDDKFKQIKVLLDEVSPSFCPAKWLQVTLHLSNGHNHSCHHPDTHKVDLKEVQENPAALHNTSYKKRVRSQMIKGERPAECDYCWKMEDASPLNVSDRLIKSSDPWAFDQIQAVAQSRDGRSVAPSYLEVSFDSTCNLRCIYCGPHISSSLMWEYKRFGGYRFLESLEQLAGKGKIPNADEQKIYTEAFWKWYPDLIKNLKVLRVTGGEPLLSGNTFKLLRKLSEENHGLLELSLNSNLAVNQIPFDKFIFAAKKLVEEKQVKSFTLYASIDSFGPQAEYIRFGLDCEEFYSRAERYLEEVKAPLVFMITYNILAISSLDRLIEKITVLKDRFGDKVVTADISMLHFPHFLNPMIASDQMVTVAKNSLELMIRNKFNNYEIEKFRRIIRLIENTDKKGDFVVHGRRDFTEFIPIYDKRKGTKFSRTFSELSATYSLWKDSYGKKD